MKTIAISRLVGSNAGEIAQLVAKTLQYDLVNKHVLEGVFRLYGLTKFGDLYTSPPNFWELANSRNLLVVTMLNDTMDALAHRGRTVILGRGGFASLNQYVDVLNVRLQAPFPIRVERLMARGKNSNRLQVEQQIKADDKARQKFVAVFYNQKWDAGSNFDLVIDTSLIPTKTATEWIIEAARALQERKIPADAQAAERAKVDPALMDAIDEAISRRVASPDGGPPVS